MTADSTPYWGPMFPDWAALPVSVPATQAYLALEDPILVGPAFQGVTLRARVAGPSDVRVAFLDDGEAETGFVEETGDDCTIRFWGGVTTAADLFANINANSMLVYATGTYDPAAIFENGDDERALTALVGGTPASTGFCRYWGPHFPDGPDVDPPAVPPTGPEPAAVFVLALENGVRLTLSWSTDVFKSYDGTERRASLLDDPRQSYAGRALLLGDDVRQVRSNLGRYAALGRPFALGLPFEESTLSADASGFVYPLADATADLDWAVPGQRVIVVSGGGSIEATIQSVAADSVTLDTGPGLVGVDGARIMPAMPVLFEPQQGFRRKRTSAGADYWDVSGRAAVYGFAGAGVPGELQLEPLADNDVFDGAYLRGRTGTAAVIEITLAASADPGITIDEALDPGGGGSLEITVEDSVSTMAELAAAINAQSSLVSMLGTWTDADIVASPGTNEFASQPLTGGLDATDPVMGAGATVTTLAGRPLWDRGVANRDTIGDSIQSMAETIDLGGIPIQIGCADEPDWGRAVAIEDDERSEWQWLKAFLSAVRGRWKSWYLPTGRADLTSTTDATSTTLTVDAAIGDYDLWESRGYTALRVEQESGVSYVTITAAVPSGSDLVLTVTGAALAAEPVLLISWCELVRFESDDIEVQFGADGFTMAANARVIHNAVDA